MELSSVTVPLRAHLMLQLRIPGQEALVMHMELAGIDRAQRAGAHYFAFRSVTDKLLVVHAPEGAEGTMELTGEGLRQHVILGPLDVEVREALLQAVEGAAADNWPM